MEASGFEDVLPLAPLQEGLWFHSRFDPSSPDIYVGQLVLDLDGPVDAATLRNSAVTVLQRHPNLRAALVQRKSGELIQVVMREVELPWRVVDLSGWDVAARGAELDALAQDERGRPFDLSRPPLTRFALARLAPDHHRLVITFHHITLDGWSTSLFLDELFLIHAAGGDATHLTPTAPYRDYLSWLVGQDQGAAEEAWRRELHGLRQATIVAPPGQVHPQAWPEFVQLEITDELTERLAALARDHRLTMNTLTQAAWAMILAQQTASDEVVFGVTVSGRPAEVADADKMIGLFVNTVPARVHCRPDRPLLEILAAVQDAHSRMTAHQHVGLGRLQQVAGIGPLFDTAYVFQSYPADFDSLQSYGDLQVRLVRAQDQNHFTLSLQVAPGPPLNLQLSYCPDVLSRDSVEAMGARLVRVLDAMVRDPWQPVGQVETLSPTERRRILLDWNDTHRDLPDITVAQLFEAHASRTPDATAIASGTKAVGYAELNAQANRLAHLLIAHGIGAEDLVALAIPRSIEAVVAMLAVAKSGAAYLPLDPEYPPRRIASMLAVARPRLLLTTGEGTRSAADATTPAVPLDDPRTIATLEAQPATNPTDCDRRRPLCPASPVYVTFTSGTTGVPKGIVTTHANLAALVLDGCWRSSGQQRILAHSPQAFDATTYEVWVPLASGGQVVLPPPGRFDLRTAAAAMKAHRVTGIYLTAKLFNLAVAETPDCLADLREIWTGAEAASPAAFRQALARIPGVRLINVYGPTETTVFATCHVVTRPSDIGDLVSIGTPMDNTSIYVLDARLKALPAGLAGEIYIGGPGVGRGYLNCPELTAERFLADPFAANGERMYRTGDIGYWRPDGQLEFVGRADDQVKVRGFRIEPREIEAALLDRPEVSRAAVVVREDRPGDQRVVAYVVAHEPARFDAALVRRSMARLLPSFMVPSAYVLLDELPLTPNGKLDRGKLPSPEFATAQGGREPRTPREQTLCDLFGEVLDLRDLTIDDDFFELGGNSLLAIRLVNKVRRTMGVEMGIQEVFRTPTVAALAARFDGFGAARAPIRRMSEESWS